MTIAVHRMMNSKLPCSEKSLMCKECSLRFASNLVLEIHSNVVHRHLKSGNLMVVSLIPQEKEQIKCRECNSGFAIMKHLLNHKATIHKRGNLMDIKEKNYASETQRLR